MGRIRRQDVDIQRKRLAREQGTIRKDWGGRLPIALCYPNSYAVGMCNLGFQSVYSLFNAAREFACERVFAEPVLIGSRSAGRGDWTGDEQGTIRKDWGGRLPIALCYPNSYAVGMCNLGFQSVYSLKAE